MAGREGDGGAGRSPMGWHGAFGLFKLILLLLLFFSWS
jgi:hypothetical protein